MDEQVERELKFDIPDGWALPDVTALLPADGTLHSTTVRLSSRYFDTPHHDLLRSGVTLRRRTGDTDTGWHLKVPSSADRTEIRLPLTDADEVPDALRTLVRALTDNANLALVATLDTERHVHALVGHDGSQLLEFADDEVSVTGLNGTLTSWREVEVELGSGADDKLLTAAARLLRDSGAQRAAIGSKLARALGATGARPLRDGTLGGLLAQYLHEQHRAMVQGDIALRRGHQVVHRTRVATRRFRSVLRVFASVMPSARAQALDVELKWYADQLGAARDVEVMRAHLQKQIAHLPAHLGTAELAEHIERSLDDQAAQADEALRAALDSDRYAALLREVRVFVEDVRDFTSRPEKDVAEFADAAERKARKRLRKATRPHAVDHDRHGARKAAKRARYAAELAQPALGKAAAKQVKRDKGVQNQLGDLQDAVVAARFLAGLAPSDDAAIAFAIGVLWQREQARAEVARVIAQNRARNH